jgi:hypothetical protein
MYSNAREGDKLFFLLAVKRSNLIAQHWMSTSRQTLKERTSPQFLRQWIRVVFDRKSKTASGGQTSHTCP